jgi:DNA-binding LacI/PurR family transcriptional regulator
MARKDILQLFQQEIEKGVIVNDGLIPTFRKLGERYSCSAATVKRIVDNLEYHGVLRTVRGRGTFVTSEVIRPKRNIRQHIGCIVLNDPFQFELEKYREHYLKSGWFFSVYNASADLQSPEREKMFLLLAQEQDFCTIILEATPKEPVNKELFKRLRCDGMKIIHLSPYLDDMAGECFFTPDFYATGQLSVVKCEVQKYRHLVFCIDNLSAPFVRLWQRGAYQMAGNTNIQILPDIIGHAPDELLSELQKLPPSTAVCCVNTEYGKNILQLAKENNLNVPGDFGLLALSPTIGMEKHCSSFTFDYRQIMHDALIYGCDLNRDPYETVQKYYQPRFVDNHTL